KLGDNVSKCRFDGLSNNFEIANHLATSHMKDCSTNALDVNERFQAGYLSNKKFLSEKTSVLLSLYRLDRWTKQSIKYLTTRLPAMIIYVLSISNSLILLLLSF